MTTELRQTLRALWSSPFFTIVVVLCLALGIGANALIYSAVDKILLNPLPFTNAGEIVRVDLSSTNPALQGQTYPIQPVNYEILLREQEFLKEWGGLGVRTFPLNLSDRTIALTGAEASPGFFRVFGIQPLHGRLFEADDGQRQVAVITESLAREQFGRVEDATGQGLVLDGVRKTVIGIVPEAQAFPNGTRLWQPLDARSLAEGERLTSRYFVYGRLKEGVSLEQAREQLSRVTEIIRASHPQLNSNLVLSMGFLAERMLNAPGATGTLGQSIWILFGAVTLLFVIAIANIASLILVRVYQRQDQLAIRMAYGASRWQIMRHLMLEAWLLAAIGSMAGIGMAYFAAPILEAGASNLLGPFRSLSIDTSVIAASAGVAFLAMTVVSIVGLYWAGRPRMAEVLKQGGGKGALSTRGATSVHNGFIVLQIALSLMLLVGAGLMLKSFSEIRQIDLGFRPDGLLTLRADAPERAAGSMESMLDFYGRVQERVAALPQVESAGATIALPVNDARIVARWNAADVPPTPETPYKLAVQEIVQPGFLETLGVSLKRGRLIQESDRTDSEPVALVSAELARKIWPNEDPIGKRVQTIIDERIGIWRRVVGVVGDIRNNGSQTASTYPFTLYIAAAQSTRPDLVRNSRLAVRVDGDPGAHARAIQQAIWAVDEDVMISNVLSMRQRLAQAVQNDELNTTVLSALAVFALILASVGIYGVLAFSTAQRRSEIGLRIALGAQPGQVTKEVVGRGLYLAGIGLAGGVLAALGLGRALQTLLYNVSAIDVRIYLFIFVVLLSVVIAAAYIPARRASRVDPVEALRSQ